MKNKQLLIFAVSLAMSLSAVRALAHAGHDREGLPIGLHRGNVEIIKGIETADGMEIYAEATVSDGTLKVYLLTLKKGASEFTAFSTKTELKNVELKVEYPRAKKTEKLSATVKDDSIEASLTPKEPNRFLVHLSTTYRSKKGMAKIQFEAQ